MVKRLLFLCLIASLLEAKPPEIEPGDVFPRLETIMAAHAKHKSLDEILVRRALENYIEQLDPAKTYFLASEVEAWQNLPETTVNQALRGYETGDFALFEEIHAQFLQVIKRRRAIEKKIARSKLPEDVDAKEFKDLSWAESREALQERLLRLRALQIQISQNVSDDSADLISKRLEKRRLKLEKRQRSDKVVLANVLKATASALDSHTTYFTPDEASEFTIQMQQRLFGIGVQLRDQLTGFEIMRVLEKGPAMREGTLQNGDLIIAVDGETVIGLDILETVSKIRGKAFTPVTLTVLRDDEKLDVEITRDEVVLEEARFETSVEPFGDGVIGCISLHTFYQDTRHSSSEDLKRAIEKMKAEYNLKGLVLDLRHNGGGLLPQAVSVTGLFISKGIVVSIKDENHKVQHLRDITPLVTWDGPLVVLVSRGTASAAEIVAGTLQDYGRAIVVGDKTTFGKGTFQTSTIDAVGGIKLDPAGEHKVTRGVYYTVSGRSPQLVGVESDIIAPSLLSHLEIGEEFSKFPLDNDQIAPNFKDDLSDIPVFHRQKARETYLFNLQEQISTYTTHLDSLKENSEQRIEKNPDYQKLITDEGEFGSNDHQYQEGLNVMKDLLFLLQQAA